MHPLRHRYTAGQGIPPHFDTVWAFGAQLGSVSLLAPSVMRFRPVFTVGVDPHAVFDIVMPPRSLVVLAGQARYYYTHRYTCACECAGQSWLVLYTVSICVQRCGSKVDNTQPLPRSAYLYPHEYIYTEMQVLQHCR